MKEVNFLLLMVIFFFLVLNISAGQNETMSLEVNVLALEFPADTVSIEVPDYLFMGDIKVGDQTEKFQVYVNNSGNVDIIVTPQLQDPSEEIFSNLYFQDRKTGNSSQEYIIGEYSFDISEPSTEGGKRSEYFWMWLDLTDFNEELEEDTIGKRADIMFIALPKIS